MSTIQAMQALFDEIADWGEATFPHSTDRSKLKHLEKELSELKERPWSSEEMAGIVLLLCHLARAHDVNLARAIRDTFLEVKERRWQEPDSDGVVEHVR